MRVLIICLLLTGCAPTFKGGATPDHSPYYTLKADGVNANCSVQRMRMVNGSVWLEC